LLINTIAKKIILIKVIFLLSILPAIPNYSQELTKSELDSLYTKFLQIRAPELLPQTEQIVELSMEEKKCGFGFVNQIKLNFDNFTIEQQSILKILLSRPVLQTSMDSPFGHFRIHYNTTGSNIPSYVSGSVEQNVMEVARALDSVYRFEIDFLGFLPPPSDNGAGGDEKYDIYINDQGGAYYGYTEWESKVGSVNWTSFLVIDNDYSGYYSVGLNGMKVTVAHEFHHGIQIGNYAVENSNSPFRDSDVFFYELTSTSMEEFVYDDVNDYYAYMQSYFSHPERAMPNQNGYNLAIWNLYIQENFGFHILKQQWELIPSTEAILAINNTLLNSGSSFPSELNNFGIWTFFTGYRSIPGKYFDEALYYPLITPRFTILFPSPPPGNLSANPTSNNFLLFNISSKTDSLIALITNGDAFAAAENPNQLFDFDYVLFADTLSGTRKLGDNYSSNFGVSNPTFWSVSEILNGLLVRVDSIVLPIVDVKESFVFPNPFKYMILSDGTQSSINITVDLINGTEVDFSVYTIGMELVYSRVKNVGPLKNNSLGINWNGHDLDNKRLASGVYFYVIKNGDNVITGKVVIFNE
jgi:hypothetical protein